MNFEEKAWLGQPDEPPTEHSLSELPVRAPAKNEREIPFQKPDVFSQYGVPKEDDPDLSEQSHAPEEQYGAW